MVAEACGRVPGAQDTAGHSAAPPAAGGGARGSPPDGCGLLSLHFGRRFPDDTRRGVCFHERVCRPRVFSGEASV